MEAAWLFGIVALALLSAALAFVVPPLLRRRLGETRSEDVDAAVFHQEIDELQRDAALDEIPPDELAAGRERARARLQAARHSTIDPRNPTRRTRTAALVVAAALPLLALAVYFLVGRPDALAPPAEEPVAGDYVGRLQSHLARQPRDARGWVLLARAHAERGKFADAAGAYEKAIAASSKVAKDPAVLCEYADALGMAQGGRLSGKPTEMIEQALAIDPNHPVALEMAGSAAYADGRYADAVGHWQALLAQLAPQSQPHVELSAALERAQRRAAVTLPRGPSPQR
jgi:cytochrome c-type biogenesis protein CcmH